VRSPMAEGEPPEGAIVSLQISIRESAGVTIVDLKGGKGVLEGYGWPLDAQFSMDSVHCSKT
jgi:hypothetical protein